MKKQNTWQKLGLTYNPSMLHSKIVSHAANPLPIHIEGDIYRVFYSGRDKENRSSVGGVDIDIHKNIVVREHKKPFFVYGEDNTFFSDGVSIGNCYAVKENKYILFMGWKHPKGDHWYGQIGRLRVCEDLSLELDSYTPFIELSDQDPISLSYPWVMQKDDKYIMWYGSTKRWDAGNNEMLHVINYALSADGNSWHKHGLAVPYKIGYAQAFSHPSVVDNLDGYDMWFSYRGKSTEKYRIGYAYSDNLTEWKLDIENSGITVSETGWDSEMIEYPFVFDHKGRRYMLYNGNSYGETGFGLAVLECT